jgi:type IV secretion system protein VirB9
MRPLLLILLMAATPCLAAQTPKPGASDARIRTVAYDAEQVVELKAVFDYQLMLEFGADERIENVSIGDGLAWQITPNKRADLLFIKPISTAVPTNMSVVTDQHRYVFRLTAQTAAGLRPDAIAYVVKFVYPASEKARPAAPPAPSAPVRKNIAYTYLGSTAALPAVVFDDGRFTYFRWAPAVSTPAIFLLDEDGRESLVNYAVRGGYVVVEQVARRFVLRNGQAVTTLVNDAWTPPTPEPDAPRPHRDQKPAGARP